MGRLSLPTELRNGHELRLPTGDLRKLHELEMEQGPPRSGGDLEVA